jgi:hypothetical protein
MKEACVLRFEDKADTYIHLTILCARPKVPSSYYIQMLGLNHTFCQDLNDLNSNQTVFTVAHRRLNSRELVVYLALALIM